MSEKSLISRLKDRFSIRVELLKYIGPGFLVTVGFIDPGNWATNIAAGSEFGYELIWVVTLSTLMLILLQHMAAHLGIVTGECLAESCRRWFPPWANWIFGASIMAACVATALAEFLGAAIGLKLITGLPLAHCAIISALAVLTLVTVQKYDSIEHIIIAFVSIIGFCYIAEVFIVKPDWAAAGVGAIVPKLDGSAIFLAMGIIGAVVMPHNIYLHSEVIQRRNWSAESNEKKRRLLRFEFLDTIVAMLAGWVINSAMVVVAAAVFFKNNILITDVIQASQTLRPLAGSLATILFSIALLCAGISSSMTACLSGGTVFTGFLGKDIDPKKGWFRVGVLITAIPAVALIFFITDTYKALIWSQVALSIQLPLTILPLILLTRSERVMGEFRNGKFEGALLYVCGALVVFFNVVLLASLVNP